MLRTTPNPRQVAERREGREFLVAAGLGANRAPEPGDVHSAEPVLVGPEAGHPAKNRIRYATNGNGRGGEPALSQTSRSLFDAPQAWR
jgi:hypothetical protein